MMNRLDDLATVTRTKAWRLSFIPHIFGNLYLWIILLQIGFSAGAFLLLFFSLLTSFGFAALGYFINEFFDQASDARAGKSNKLHALSSSRKSALLFLLLTLTFVPWLYLPATIVSAGLIALQLSLFLVYAAPPLRLKKNAYLSGITDALYAYVIPLVLSYYTYYLASGSNIFHVYFIIGYCVLLFVAGYRNIIIHYVNDLAEDERSGLITLPNRLGAARTNKLIKMLMFAELVFACSVIFTLSQYNVLFLVLYLPVLYLVYRSVRTKKKQEDTILAAQQNHHLPDLFYQFYAPAFILLILISVDGRWGILIPFHLVLFIPFFRFHPVLSWWQRINFRLYFIALRYVLSWMVNYTIFFVFLLAGVNLKKRNTSAIAYLKDRFSGNKYHKKI